jgi:hypothetical protein
MIFRLFSKHFRHFLTCCSVTIQSPYASIHCRWTSLADKYLASKKQITLPTSYRDIFSTVTAIEHQLIPEEHVTDSCVICCMLPLPTSTAPYWKKSACLTQNLQCRKLYLLHTPQTEICYIYYTATADFSLFPWFWKKVFFTATPISPYDAIC